MVINNKKNSMFFKTLIYLSFLTIFLPILLAISQIIFTYPQLSFSHSKPENWSNITNTFSLAIELFKVLISVTGVFGLWYKITQTERQIKQVESKDNFSIFIQHREYIIDTLKEQLITTESQNNYSSHPSILYIALFPENTPKKVINFDVTSKVPPIEFPNFLFAIKSINHSIEIKKEEITERYVEGMINEIQKDFEPFGFRFIVGSYNISELASVIKTASDLLRVINYFAPMNSRELEAAICYFNQILLNELINPYKEEVY